MLDILYYPEGSRGPVREYFSGLAKERPKAFARLAMDLEVLGAEGLRSQQITVRPLGDKLWELKRVVRWGSAPVALWGVERRCLAAARDREEERKDAEG